MGVEREAIRLEDVCYAYPSGDFCLKAEGLAFAYGQCAAIRGHNGSGKTTLGKLVAGLLRPAQGRVLLDGEDIVGWPLGKIGSRVGYLFQEPSRQIFAPTVLEEITFPLTLRGMAKKEATAFARELLARFDMDALEDATTFPLSRGEKQRLAIVAMLATSPGFLVLDEPTTGLDARRKGILGSMLRQLMKEGIGILLISHDGTFVEEYVTTTHWMAEGRVISS